MLISAPMECYAIECLPGKPVSICSSSLTPEIWEAEKDLTLVFPGDSNAILS